MLADGSMAGTHQAAVAELAPRSGRRGTVARDDVGGAPFPREGEGGTGCYTKSHEGLTAATATGRAVTLTI
jgi:hypothetical protein